MGVSICVLDNKHIKIDDLQAFPLGKSFSDFISLDIKSSLMPIVNQLNDLWKSKAISQDNIHGTEKELSDLLTGIHPYFKAYEEFFSQPFYMIQNALTSIDIAKNEGMFDLQHCDNALDLAENSLINTIKYECNNLANMLENECKNKMIPYQNIFKNAAIACLNFVNISDSGNTLDKFFYYKETFNKDLFNCFNGSVSSNILRRAGHEYDVIKTGIQNIIVEYWEADDIFPIIYQEFFQMIKNNVYIKKCANCGMLFLPENRIDTAYCDRVYMNTGKTCKDIGATKAYQEKVNSNPALAAYKKAYQSKYAKTVKPHRTNALKKAEALKTLKTWQYEAKSRLALLEKEKNNDEAIQEFCKWLKNEKSVENCNSLKE